MLIDGVHVPLTAPFYRDGRSYLRKLEHNVGRYSLAPVAGLVAFTPGTEAAELSHAEAADSLKVVADAAAAEKVLVAGVSKPSVATALEMAELAAQARFDALLLSVPSKLSRAEQVLHVHAVADRAELPVLLWGGALEVEVIAELAGHPNVIGLYDVALTVERLKAVQAATSGKKHEAMVTQVFAPVTQRMRVALTDGPATFVAAESLSGGAALATAPPIPAIKTRTKAVGFQVMAAGSMAGLVDLLAAGAVGALPEIAASIPQGVHEVYAAFKDGDPALAALKADRVTAADEVLRRLGIGAVKYGCDLSGYYGGSPRLPRLPLTSEQRAEVERALGTIRA